MQLSIDLNADVGESTGSHRHGDDDGVMPFITSANIACGFHAGDPVVMRDTVELAAAHGVAVGAHPSLADREGFGRAELPVSPREVENLVAYQVGALAGVAAARGVPLAHVKPHGALYNMSARRLDLAQAVARAVRAVDRGLAVFALSGSQLVRAAEDAGLSVVSEGFADRGYSPDGSLAPRGQAGALLTDPEVVVARAIDMVRDQSVTALDGTRLPTIVRTLCVHSDTAGAALLAKRLRLGLVAAGIAVAAPRVHVGS